jgi:xanthine dehydrogenase YagR molybdenum-binding subunit
MIHEAFHNTSSFEAFSDATTSFTRQVYACPNLHAPLKVAATDLATPTWMRAPGAVSGMFALECAMDELSYALKIDPWNCASSTTQRLTRKAASRSPARRCASATGWAPRSSVGRTASPSRARCATVVCWWAGAWRRASGARSSMPASARITFRADGTASVASATSDIGPGTYTVMTMIAAEFLGLRLDQVHFELGDTTATEGAGARRLVDHLQRRFGGARCGAHHRREAAGTGEPGCRLAAARRRVPPTWKCSTAACALKSDPSRAVDIAEVMRRTGTSEITRPHDSTPSPERAKYASLAHGAQFVEVKVDPDLGTVKVSRVIEVTACGKILNPLASHSQEIGGVVWGIGMALEEATEIDHRYGRIMNANLQHYHVPVNADVHAIETIFVEEDDTIVNPLGVKGMGELGMVGIPAAIANAIFHATGKRMRDLPITPEKLM